MKWQGPSPLSLARLVLSLGTLSVVGQDLSSSTPHDFLHQGPTTHSRQELPVDYRVFSIVVRPLAYGHTYDTDGNTTYNTYIYVCMIVMIS